VDSGLIAGVDHPLSVLPARRHGLFRHHVSARGRHLHRLLRMQPAGRRQNDDVRIGAGEQGLERPESRGPSALLGLRDRRRIDVTYANELGPGGVLLDGIKVIGRDPAAPDQRKPDPPVRDEGLGDEHRSGGFHDGREV
jgi:hypothetical protein